MLCHTQAFLRSPYCLQHGRDGYRTSLAMGDVYEPESSLMCVDDLRQLEARIDLVFEMRRYSQDSLSV
jgi:hypothetical protein